MVAWLGEILFHSHRYRPTLGGHDIGRRHFFHFAAIVSFVFEIILAKNICEKRSMQDHSVKSQSMDEVRWALLAYGTLRVAGRPCYRRKSRAIAVDNVPAVYNLIRASFVFDESKCIKISNWKYQDVNIQDFDRTVSKDSMAWSFRVRILYTFASISECM